MHIYAGDGAFARRARDEAAALGPSWRITAPLEVGGARAFRPLRRVSVPWVVCLFNFFGSFCVVWRRFVFGARKLPRGAASPHLSMRYRPQCLDRPLPRFPRKWRAGPPMGSRLRNRNASGDIAGRIFAPYNIMLVGVVRRCDERRRNCRDSIP